MRIIDYIDSNVKELQEGDLYRINTTTGMLTAFKRGDEHLYYWNSGGQTVQMDKEGVEDFFYSRGWTVESIASCEQKIIDPNRSSSKETVAYDRILSEVENNARVQSEYVQRSCSTAAAQNTKFMADSIDRGESSERQVGNSRFTVSRDFEGNAKFFVEDKTGKTEVSRPDFIDRMTRESISDYRRNNYIDYDFVMKTNNGIIACDHLNGSYNYTFINDNENRVLSREEFGQILRNNNIQEVKSNTSISKAMLMQKGPEESIRSGSYLEHTKDDLDPEILDEAAGGRKRLINELSRNNDSSKRALKEALNHADKANSLYNERTNEKTAKMLIDMERQCEVGKSVSSKVNGIEFTVTKNENGTYTYKTTHPEPQQEMNRKNFSDALFTENKKESYEKSQEKGIELAIVPITKDIMLVIRPADIGSKKENAFRDGNEKYNYFLLSNKNNSERQVTEKEVKRLFTKHNITEKEISETITHSLDVAKEKAKNLTRTAARSAGNIARNAFERHVVGQMSQGLSMGEDMARIL